MKRFYLWLAQCFQGMKCGTGEHDWSLDQTPYASNGLLYCLRCGENAYIIRETT